tara:strand:+ start:17755 stop:17934 length:180 start_codon:yes stop_codon:yes gene_type:complete
MPNEPEHPRRVQLRRTIHKNRVATGADMAGVVVDMATAIMVAVFVLIGMWISAVMQVLM